MGEKGGLFNKNSFVDAIIAGFGSIARVGFPWQFDPSPQIGRKDDEPINIIQFSSCKV